MEITSQEQVWASDFGSEYTERNTFEVEELNNQYIQRYGVKRESMNKKFLNELDIFEENILEVGSNVGMQLKTLQKMGYKSLYGIELQEYAIEKAKQFTKSINIIKGLADDIPFKDKFFNMVFTSGVLIHIPPENLDKVMSEMVRVSNKYIWGFEYYSHEYKEVEYRGNKSLLWKGDFSKIFLENHSNLELVMKEQFKYKESDLVDCMYLLKKK